MVEIKLGNGRETQSHDSNDVVFADDKFSTVKKLIFLKGLGM